ncbi:MAG: hypothetical protein ABI585_13230 [Betaproteobacteria bacterium]
MNDATQAMIDGVDERIARVDDALARAKAEDKAPENAPMPAGDELDDIARIERRMEARRASIKGHLADARSGVERTSRSWPIIAAGAVAAAIAIGYVVARQTTSPQRRLVDRAVDRVRETPDAVRRTLHRATRPPSAAWTERAAAAAGFAMAVARAMPQFRALAASIQQRRRER